MEKHHLPGQEIPFVSYLKSELDRLDTTSLAEWAKTVRPVNVMFRSVLTLQEQHRLEGTLEKALSMLCRIYPEFPVAVCGISIIPSLRMPGSAFPPTASMEIIEKRIKRGGLGLVTILAHEYAHLRGVPGVTYPGNFSSQLKYCINLGERDASVYGLLSSSSILTRPSKVKVGFTRCSLNGCDVDVYKYLKQFSVEVTPDRHAALFLPLSEKELESLIASEGDSRIALEKEVLGKNKFYSNYHFRKLRQPAVLLVFAPLDSLKIVKSSRHLHLETNDLRRIAVHSGFPARALEVR